MLHSLRIYRFIEYGPQSSKGCVCCCTTCVFTSLLGTAYNHPRDAFIAAPLALSLNYWSRSTYNHPREASVAAPLVHALVFQVRSTIIHWMRLLMHHLCMHRSIGYGLQSFKECICCYTACTFISLSSTVYNHLRDASMVLPLVHVSVHRVRFTITQGMRLLPHPCAFISLLGTV